MYAERLLPHDIDSEESVIGSLLIDGDAFLRLAGALKPDDFYREKNALCFAAAAALYRRGEAIDQVTLARQLKTAGHLDTVGGMAYLSHLVAVTPTSANAEHYAAAVAEMRRRRDCINIGGRLAAAAYEGAESEAAARSAVLELLRIDHAQEAKPKNAQELYDAYMDDLYQEAIGEPGRHGRVKPTGYPMLDSALNGWEDGMLYILGGRPSMGKTLMLTNFALRVAEQGTPVFFFTLEVSERALLRRMATSLAQLDMWRHRQAGPTERELNLDSYLDALNTISQMSLWVCEKKGLRPMDMRALLEAHQQEHGAPGLVVVDYLNEIRPDRSRHNAYEEATDAVRGVKELTGVVKAPYVVGAQFSRALENRPENSRRPVLADFRDTGRIEEVANVIMGLFRPAAVWRTEQEWERAHPGERYPADLLELLVLKQQEGPVGYVPFKVNLGSGHIKEAPDAV